MDPIARALTLTLLAALGACTGHYHDAPERPALVVAGKPLDYAVARGIVYTPEGWPAALPADVYTPEGAGPFPAVLVAHGGGWMRGSRDEMNDVARALAQRGYVVVNADYRLAPRWRHPAPVDDLHAAVDFMHRNADALRIDSARIGVWGYSAGAHLLALVAARDAARVHAAVLGALPADLVRGAADPVIRQYIGADPQRESARFRAASPVYAVSPAMPPTLLYHGTLDARVPYQNTAMMHRALLEAGVPAEWYSMVGDNHVTAALFDGDAVLAGIGFLDRRLNDRALQLARLERLGRASFAAAAIEPEPRDAAGATRGARSIFR